MEKSQSIHKWLEGKSMEDLDIVEAGNRLLFADSIKRLGPKGQLVEEQIRVRVPRQLEIVKARAEAKALAEKYKIDREKDEDLFSRIDDLCLLAQAIREFNEPHGQAYTAEQYLNSYDPTSLDDLRGRLTVYTDMANPCITELTPEAVVDAAVAIASKKNISPLADIDGQEHGSFIVSMATMLTGFLIQSSFKQSQENSTPEPSPAANSI